MRKHFLLPASSPASGRSLFLSIPMFWPRLWLSVMAMGPTLPYWRRRQILSTILTDSRCDLWPPGGSTRLVDAAAAGERADAADVRRLAAAAHEGPAAGGKHGKRDTVSRGEAGRGRRKSRCGKTEKRMKRESRTKRSDYFLHISKTSVQIIKTKYWKYIYTHMHMCIHIL